MSKLRSVISAVIKCIVLAAAVFMLVNSSCRLYSYNKARINSERLANEVFSKNEISHKAPVSVDFEKLSAENDDIIAWLYCEGTPINYPVVQAEDNSAYLRRGIDKSYSLAGSLFADFRCSADFSDNNTVIYGHNMKNDSMFGILPEYRSQEYFDGHSVMYILTGDKDYKVRLVAGVTVKSTDPIYTLPLADDAKEDFAAYLLENSSFESDYTFDADDRFVMLSTCSYEFDNARYVLVGCIEEL